MDGSDALIHLRVPAATKARWVRESRAAGMRLTDWIVERVERNGVTEMTATSRRDALSIKMDFEEIKSRGGHAAIDFRDGELVLMCSKPSQEKSTWGRGAVSQSYGDDWVRLVEC